MDAHEELAKGVATGMDARSVRLIGRFKYSNSDTLTKYRSCHRIPDVHTDCIWPSPDVAAGNFVAALQALNLQDQMTGLEHAVQPAVQPPSV